MATYLLNEPAVAHARRLIDSRQYVLESVWGDVQPDAEDENAFLEAHSWDEFAAWHLGLTEGASDDTKARYGFVYGDSVVSLDGLASWCQIEPRSGATRRRMPRLNPTQHLDHTRARPNLL